MSGGVRGPAERAADQTLNSAEFLNEWGAHLGALFDLICGDPLIQAKIDLVAPAFALIPSNQAKKVRAAIRKSSIGVGPSAGIRTKARWRLRRIIEKISYIPRTDYPKQEVQKQQFIGKMARMYPILIAMGFMIVAIAFGVGYVNSQTVAEYFSQPKVLRETTLLAERASIESVGLWLPYFKFLGIGLILGGIVMALRIIIDGLKGAGEEVLANLPEKIRPTLPSPPWYGPMMPMLGLPVFIVALIVGLGKAADARALFANPLPTIDAAGAGTALLATLEGIKATSAHSSSSASLPNS